jgi:hypothetical protein
LLGTFSALSAAATATTTTATFAVLGFLDRTRLRLGNGRRLFGSCTRFLHRPGFARRALFLHVARSLTRVIARLVALPLPGLTISPWWLRRALRGPGLRSFTLLIPGALSTLTRLNATLVALISAPITVLPSAPAAWRFGANRCGLRRRFRRFGPEPSQHLGEPVFLRECFDTALDGHRRGSTRRDALDHRFLARLLGFVLPLL